jgi:putative hydrolase of the HAD superfamily
VPAPIPAGVRAVFFDAVGTLLHPRPTAAEVYAAVARRHGRDISVADTRARFVAAFRKEEEADRAAGWATSEAREAQRWRRIVAATLAGVDDPETCFSELFDHFARPQSWQLDPDAGPLVAQLAGRGLILGIGSNYDARLLTVLAGFPELAPAAGRVVVSAAVGFRKPAGQFFRALVRAAGCAPAEVLFVGDDPENDYEGARAAGLRAVLVGADEGGGPCEVRVEALRDLVP